MSRYDGRTSTFSPEGRILQVEYSLASIQRAPLALGLITKEGIVWAAERRAKAPLQASSTPELKDISGEKVYKIDEHIGFGVAGLTADANVLIDHSRLRAQQHRYSYNEPMAAEDMCQTIADICQGYTMQGSQRPFGVAFLIGAYDRFYGFQLYCVDPSGNYSAWKAYAIGNNESAAQGLLKQDWNEDLSLEDGVQLALKIMSKTLDAVTLNADLVEVATLRRAPKSEPKFHIFTNEELKPQIVAAEALRKKEDEEREERRKERAAAASS